MSTRSTFTLLCVCGCMLSQIISRAAGQEPSDVDHRLPMELVKRFGEYGLPLPPKNAQLVQLHARMNKITTENGEKYNLAFRYVDPEGNDVVAIGTELESVSNIAKIGITIREFELTSALDIRNLRVQWKNIPFEVNAGFATAIQCEYLGLHSLGEQLLNTSIRAEAGHPRSLFFQAANVRAQTMLARVAWAHWANELVRPGTNRTDIARRMEALISQEPSLQSPSANEFLRLVRATSSRTDASSDSIERAIDALIDMSNQIRPDGEMSIDPRYLKVVELGFDAVPQLIRHLDDDRLSRCITLGFNNFPTHHCQVREIVSELLAQLAGTDLRNGTLRELQSHCLQEADVERWWAIAKNEGEERYVVQHVLPDDPNRQFPNDSMLRIIERKYPNYLPDLYLSLLNLHPQLESSSFARAIARSSLPHDSKLEVLNQAASSARLDQRRDALWALKDVDRSLFLRRLKETLDSLPTRASQSFWRCPEADFATLASDANDKSIWTALKSAADQAEVGLRMEMLQNVAKNVATDNLRSSIGFLATFLTDVTVRDARSSELYEGLYAGIKLSPQLEVRDFAASLIAKVYALPEEPTSEWTSVQWLKFRERVGQELSKFPSTER